MAPTPKAKAGESDGKPDAAWSLFKPATWGKQKKIRVAHEGVQLDMYYHPELKRWVERGKEHEAANDPASAPPPTSLGDLPTPSVFSRDASSRKALSSRYVMQNNLSVSSSTSDLTAEPGRSASTSVLPSAPSGSLVPSPPPSTNGRGFFIPPLAPASNSAPAPNEPPGRGTSESGGKAAADGFKFFMPSASADAGQDAQHAGSGGGGGGGGSAWAGYSSGVKPNPSKHRARKSAPDAQGIAGGAAASALDFAEPPSAPQPAAGHRSTADENGWSQGGFSSLANGSDAMPEPLFANGHAAEHVAGTDGGRAAAGGMMDGGPEVAAWGSGAAGALDVAMPQSAWGSEAPEHGGSAWAGGEGGAAEAEAHEWQLGAGGLGGAAVVEAPFPSAFGGAPPDTELSVGSEQLTAACSLTGWAAAGAAGQYSSSSRLSSSQGLLAANGKSGSLSAFAVDGDAASLAAGIAPEAHHSGSASSLSGPAGTDGYYGEAVVAAPAAFPATGLPSGLHGAARGLHSKGRELLGALAGYVAQQVSSASAAAGADGPEDAFESAMHPGSASKLDGPLPWELPEHLRYGDDFLSICTAWQRNNPGKLYSPELLLPATAAAAAEGQAAGEVVAGADVAVAVVAVTDSASHGAAATADADVSAWARGHAQRKQQEEQQQQREEVAVVAVVEPASGAAAVAVEQMAAWSSWPVGGSASQQQQQQQQQETGGEDWFGQQQGQEQAPHGEGAWPGQQQQQFTAAATATDHAAEGGFGGLVAADGRAVGQASWVQQQHAGEDGADIAAQRALPGGFGVVEAPREAQQEAGFDPEGAMGEGQGDGWAQGQQGGTWQQAEQQQHGAWQPEGQQGEGEHAAWRPPVEQHQQHDLDSWQQHPSAGAESQQQHQHQQQPEHESVPVLLGSAAGDGGSAFFGAPAVVVGDGNGDSAAAGVHAWQQAAPYQVENGLEAASSFFDRQGSSSASDDATASARPFSAAAVKGDAPVAHEGQHGEEAVPPAQGEVVEVVGVALDLGELELGSWGQNGMGGEDAAAAAGQPGEGQEAGVAQGGEEGQVAGSPDADATSYLAGLLQGMRAGRRPSDGALERALRAVHALGDGGAAAAAAAPASGGGATPTKAEGAAAHVGSETPSTGVAVDGSASLVTPQRLPFLAHPSPSPGSGSEAGQPSHMQALGGESPLVPVQHVHADGEDGQLGDEAAAAAAAAGFEAALEAMRAELQADFDSQLAARTSELEERFEARLSAMRLELEAEYAARLAERDAQLEEQRLRCEELQDEMDQLLLCLGQESRKVTDLSDAMRDAGLDPDAIIAPIEEEYALMDMPQDGEAGEV